MPLPCGTPRPGPEYDILTSAASCRLSNLQVRVLQTEPPSGPGPGSTASAAMDPSLFQDTIVTNLRHFLLVGNNMAVALDRVSLYYSRRVGALRLGIHITKREVQSAEKRASPEARGATRALRRASANPD